MIEATISCGPFGTTARTFRMKWALCRGLFEVNLSDCNLSMSGLSAFN